MMISTDATTFVSRVQTTPVVPAGSVPGYGALFNAGLIYADGRYWLFVRGVRDGYRVNPGHGPRFFDYISDILVFSSTCGHDYTYDYVLASAGDHGVNCYEDPRLQWITSDGEQHLVMTYTNLPAEGSNLPWRIGAHRLGWGDGRFEVDAESGRLLGPEGVENKDCVLFNLADERVAMIHRVHPNMQIAIFDDLDHLWHASDSYWDEYMPRIEEHTIIEPSAGALGVGAGAPPVVTQHGLLLLFHERNAQGVYTMKAALLDEATGMVKSMLTHPIFAPELHWEVNGDVDNVVFVQGAHVLDDQNIYTVYGAADSHVGAAIVRTEPLLSALLA